MAGRRRADLIGAWKLVSYREVPVDGSEPFEPLGANPKGITMYTPDGYMSAQLSKAERPGFASGDWFKGTEAEYVADAASYIAYSGPFHVDEEAGTLTHSIFVSLFPNWTGQTQARAVQLDGDTLKLGPTAPSRQGRKITLVARRSSIAR